MSNHTPVITPQANISAADLARLYSLKTVSQDYITAETPMGANLIQNGATFRVWAPRAKQVYIKINADSKQWKPDSRSLLVNDQNGYWAGYVDGVKDGDTYLFYVVGEGSEGYKRDPYARELGRNFPECDCIVRDATSYPWNVQDFRPPAFNDLIIYEMHVGTFYGVDSFENDNRLGRVATFLDVIDRVEYLVELGINAIELLPIDSFTQPRSMGYSCEDIYSPEMDYTVKPEELDHYVSRINSLLAKKNCPHLTLEHLIPQINQLKAMVDIFHLYGIAVIFDVVYNHAGSGNFDPLSLYFLDRAKDGNNNQSLYFTDQDEGTGGLIYAYWNQDVRQFLINNAKFFLDEYKNDGFRYDEVTIMARHGGWSFCQDLTNTLKYKKPNAINIAEYWENERWWALWSLQDKGAGFAAIWHDGARESIRSAIGQAANGAGAYVNLDQVRDNALFRPSNFPAAWNPVQYLESHDEVRSGREARVASLADGSDHHSWYAKSRARTATGILLTAPGIPMLFMGEEFLEDKEWNDDPNNTLIWWDGLKFDSDMRDFQRFTRELIAVRRSQPALRSEPVNVYHVHNDNRVMAYHRWVPNEGRDVVVVVSLNESTYWNYWLGFPGVGRWKEIFNSDVYESWVNPQVAGNGGEIWANGGPMHNLPNSAGIVIPANSILVFARE
jgi:1,4-alpha-glucan branching enzyme